MIRKMLLLPVLWTGILLSSQAFALDCRRDASVYCDASWRGFADFQTLLAPYQVEWKNKFDSDENLIQIWSNAADIPIELIQKKLRKGARILILDESQTTVSLFRENINKTAVSVDSPFLADAFHINGNPHLPVFSVSKQMKDVFNLPEESVQWRLAFNHPTPIAYQNIQNSLDYVFAFAVEDEGSNGAVFVIRDESMMTRLMLHTYDNAQFLSALIHTLCRGDPQCRIDLYEPSANLDVDAPATEIDVDSNHFGGIADKFRDIQSQVKELSSEKLKNVPWKIILMVLFASWILIGMFSTFNLGRSKPE